MKTNAARILDRLGIAYELRTYEVDLDDLTAESVARKVGLPADPTSGPDRVRQWFNAEIEPGGTLTLTPAGPGNFTRLTVDRVDWRAED